MEDCGEYWWIKSLSNIIALLSSSTSSDGCPVNPLVSNLPVVSQLHVQVRRFIVLGLHRVMDTRESRVHRGNKPRKSPIMTWRRPRSTHTYQTRSFVFEEGGETSQQKVGPPVASLAILFAQVSVTPEPAAPKLQMVRILAPCQAHEKHSVNTKDLLQRMSRLEMIWGIEATCHCRSV